ncbi:MAG: NAD(P)H-binding protein [Anaerolineaceae bacterium]|nr:NAD(P)H-binding protein [Anaerolineaceae bacterium]
MVTGGTGFVGQILVRQLVAEGKPVRILLRPSIKTPSLPKGVSVEVAVSSLFDERSLRAAMQDVAIIFHLAGDERQGTRANLTGVDIEGTQSLTHVASQVGVSRIFYLSHLGADRASAYALLKSKAISEGHVMNCGIDYTIFRSAIIFGRNDQFTSSLARLLKYSPGFAFIPGDGSIILQPISVEDLVACMILSMDDPNSRNTIYSVGGGEYLSLLNIIQIIMDVTKKHRFLVPISPVFLRTITLWVEQVIRRSPISIHWLDYVATDRTCSLDTLPRIFGIIPERLSNQLDYLRGKI